MPQKTAVAEHDLDAAALKPYFQGPDDRRGL